MINPTKGIKYNSIFSFKKQYFDNPLYKYKLSDNERRYIAAFQCASDYIDDSQETWEIYQKLLQNAMCNWLINVSENERKCPWKIYIYSDNEKDYTLLYAILTKYFIDNDINSKIIEPHMLEILCSGKQKGKSFVIYPKSNEEFKKIACDLDYIIKVNHLEQDCASIKGTRKLGSTNRIFYRYEYSSGKYKDIILDLKNSRDYAYYSQYYDSNREDSYLAADMSVFDDPFLNLLQ